MVGPPSSWSRDQEDTVTGPISRRNPAPLTLRSTTIVSAAEGGDMLLKAALVVLPVWLVGALRSPEAGELFVERARAVKPDFELTDDNARQVIAICGALDNVPLALELAAARLRVLTPTVLMERLDHALPLLVGGARDLPARQRTLRSTRSWLAVCAAVRGDRAPPGNSR